MSDDQKKSDYEPHENYHNPETFKLGDREPRFIYDKDQFALRPVKTDYEWDVGESRPPQSNTVPTNPQENYPDADVDYAAQATAKDSANSIPAMGSLGDGTNSELRKSGVTLPPGARTEFKPGTQTPVSTTQPPPDGPPAKQQPVPDQGKIDGPVIDKAEMQRNPAASTPPKPQESGKVNPPNSSTGTISSKDHK